MFSIYNKSHKDEAPVGSRMFSHNMDSVVLEPCHQDVPVRITLIQELMGRSQLRSELGRTVCFTSRLIPHRLWSAWGS